MAQGNSDAVSFMKSVYEEAFDMWIFCKQNGSSNFHDKRMKFKSEFEKTPSLKIKSFLEGYGITVPVDLQANARAVISSADRQKHLSLALDAFNEHFKTGLEAFNKMQDPFPSWILAGVSPHYKIESLPIRLHIPQS